MYVIDVSYVLIYADSMKVHFIVVLKKEVNNMDMKEKRDYVKRKAKELHKEKSHKEKPSGKLSKLEKKRQKAEIKRLKKGK